MKPGSDLKCCYGLHCEFNFEWRNVVGLGTFAKINPYALITYDGGEQAHIRPCVLLYFSPSSSGERGSMSTCLVGLSLGTEFCGIPLSVMAVLHPSDTDDGIRLWLGWARIQSMRTACNKSEKCGVPAGLPAGLGE